ncbi:MAG: hypothetical protein MHMPM18_004380 [Marteilia pararefringens]
MLDSECQNKEHCIAPTIFVFRVESLSTISISPSATPELSRGYYILVCASAIFWKKMKLCTLSKFDCKLSKVDNFLDHCFLLIIIALNCLLIADDLSDIQIIFGIISLVLTLLAILFSRIIYGNEMTADFELRRSLMEYDRGMTLADTTKSCLAIILEIILCLGHLILFKKLIEICRSRSTKYKMANGGNYSII